MRPSQNANAINIVLAFIVTGCNGLIPHDSHRPWLIIAAFIALVLFGRLSSKIECPLCQTPVLQNGNWRTFITFRKTCSKCGGPI